MPGDESLLEKLGQVRERELMERSEPVAVELQKQVHTLAQHRGRRR